MNKKLKFRFLTLIRRAYTPIWVAALNIKSWLEDHLVPKYRYHMLDLRQPKTSKDDLDYYRHGYLDFDSALLYATFNLLKRFMKGYNSSPREDMTEPHMVEAKLILNWWVTERKTDQKKSQRLYKNYHQAMKDGSRREVERTFEIYQNHINEMMIKEEEMLIRLIKIRHLLWT